MFRNQEPIPFSQKWLPCNHRPHYGNDLITRCVLPFILGVLIRSSLHTSATLSTLICGEASKLYIIKHVKRTRRFSMWRTIKQNREQVTPSFLNTSINGGTYIYFKLVYYLRFWFWCRNELLSSAQEDSAWKVAKSKTKSFQKGTNKDLDVISPPQVTECFVCFFVSPPHHVT